MFLLKGAKIQEISRGRFTWDLTVRRREVIDIRQKKL